MPATPHRSALVAGPTGVVGRIVLQNLLDNPNYHSVKALSRRPLGFTHPRLQELRLTDQSPAALGKALEADDVFCCLGTTLKAAGSKAAFERVDYHLVVELARAVKSHGAQQFVVVSAAGSSGRSPSFYSRVKARMEQAVQELNFRSTHVLRPALLMAERSESRPAEKLAQKLMPLINPLLRGKLAIYRSVAATDVAAAMVTLALRDVPGFHIHHLPIE